MENDPFLDTEVVQQRADTEQARSLAAKQEAADITWMMSDPRGRRIVWAQLSAAGMTRTSFSTDAMLMAFNEGYRNHGLRLSAQIMAHCPDLYLTMMKEQSK